ncbi:helix-turn-helix domain-containing protein [Enterococcus sp. HY326]|uniref:helix-turn-helix domain-containing protein n=1 Tax=Enterococcus sp. HY326 TaxID=2971265 RepID=UPI0022403D4B|nr:helix-turn-helix domain-containing protein [Enterococcus sp. HY326]
MNFGLEQWLKITPARIYLIQWQAKTVTAINSTDSHLEYLQAVLDFQEFPFFMVFKDAVYGGTINLKEPNQLYVMVQTQGIVNPHLFANEIIFLDFLINQRELTPEAITVQGLPNQHKPILLKTTEDLFQHIELAEFHNPYDQELREMDSIEQGNVELLQKSFEETYSGKPGILAKDQLRNLKNLCICVIALASRAAIRGGLQPEESFTLVDQSIMQLEEFQNQNSLILFLREIEITFAKMVAQVRLAEGHQQNPLIIKTKRLISQQLHQKISVQDLALDLKVTPEYLVHVFKNGEEQTIKQYILKEKIRYAENLLRYSEKSLGEIASTLAFSDQSHFSQTFKKIRGLTPKDYQKKFRQE